MTQFRKKAVVIEAWPIGMLLVDARTNWRALPEAVRKAYDRGEIRFQPAWLEVTTLEGVMTGHREDWLIQGVQGELYPCKPDIFALTYEAVG